MNKFKYQGEALRYLRKRANLTMLEVGNNLGKTKSWLSEIENGRKNIYFDDARVLCSMYGSSLQELADLIKKYSE